VEEINIFTPTENWTPVAASNFIYPPIEHRTIWEDDREDKESRSWHFSSYYPTISLSRKFERNHEDLSQDSR
jgi:hypothetical protein